MDLHNEHLLKLRLVVARLGEMDLNRWWNTNGQLGRLGASVLRRGFPRTYRFAQARAVFAVAGHRCREVFDSPGSVTLWDLPAAVEDELEGTWEQWLDRAEEWEPFFQSLEQPTGTDLSAVLRDLGLAGERDLEALSRLRRSAEGRAVPLPGVFSGSDEAITLLALAFARGEPGALAVPHMRKADA